MCGLQTPYCGNRPNKYPLPCTGMLLDQWPITKVFYKIWFTWVPGYDIWIGKFSHLPYVTNALGIHDWVGWIGGCDYRLHLGILWEWEGSCRAFKDWNLEVQYHPDTTNIVIDTLRLENPLLGRTNRCMGMVSTYCFLLSSKTSQLTVPYRVVLLRDKNRIEGISNIRQRIKLKTPSKPFRVDRSDVLGFDNCFGCTQGQRAKKSNFYGSSFLSCLHRLRQ